MFLFANNVLNILLTIVLVGIYVVLGIFINKLILRRQNENKGGIGWFYLLLFIIFVVLWE